MGFWSYLLLFNFCFFLPYYILNFKNQPNPFHFLTSGKITVWNKVRFIYSKISSDPFRINFEFTLLILIGLWVGQQSSLAVITCTIVGVLTWILIIYAGIMKYIFHRDPVFKSDWQLIQYGLQMTHRQRYWLFPLIALVLLLMIGICYYFSYHLLSMSVDLRPILYVIVVLTALGLIKSHRVRYDKYFNRTVLSSLMYSYRNWTNSGKYDFLMGKDEDYFKSLSPIRSLDLKDRPNLNIFCIESYGGVVYEDAVIRDIVLPAIQRFEHRLRDKGYHIASGLSESPQIGGGSWKCYSTFNYGMKIDDDLLYNLLFKNLDGFQSYKSIFHLFKDQGYTNYLLCPLGNYAEGTVDWDLINRNFHSDHYLEYKDMEYTGTPLRFFGNTESPPDQYSIHKAAEIICCHDDDPYFLFFTSLNSHYPFTSPTRVLDDWKSLNDPNQDIGTLQRSDYDLKTLYGKAIAYQLEVFLDYIDRSEEELFVLFGDHQPPFVEHTDSGKATPVHIISKSAKLVDEFKQHRFSEGLLPPSETLIKHEGFLSIFVAGMQRAYGSGEDNEVLYQPDGAILSDD